MINPLQITREAVCLADDFAGPLDMTLEVPTDALLSGVLEVIIDSRFLQFSGALTALSGGVALARVFSDGQVEYFVSPLLSASECISDSQLEFRLGQAGL